MGALSRLDWWGSWRTELVAGKMENLDSKVVRTLPAR